MRHPTFALAFVLLVAGSAAAEPFGVGATLPALTLNDQHGNPHSLDASLRAVLFSREMGGGGIIREALKPDGKAFLEAHRAIYVADVSRMPALVRRFLAKPRMRRRPYAMLLDEDGAPTAEFPSADGKATAIFVEKLRVVRIEHLDSAEALRAAIEGSAPAGE